LAVVEADSTFTTLDAVTASGSSKDRAARAIAWLRQNFVAELSVAALAESAA
jgi:hypothetical protein